MADKETKRRIIFSFLDDILRLWREKFLNIEKVAIAFSLNEEFSPILKEKMVFHISSVTLV